MSEESTATSVSEVKDEQNKNGEMEDDNHSNPALSSDDSPASENAETPTEKVHDQENLQLIASSRNLQENINFVCQLLESKVEAAYQSRQQQLNTYNAPTEPKSSVAIDAEQPSVKCSEAKSLEASEVEQPSVKPDDAKSVAKTDEVDQSSAKSSEAKPLENDAGESSGKSREDKPLENDADQSSAKSSEAKPLENDVDQSSSKSSEAKPLENDADQSSLKSNRSNDPKSLVKMSAVDQSSEKPATSSEISPSEVPASDKGLEEVTDNIKQIYEGLKDLKISAQEAPEIASGKKGRKAPATPRARSTPVKPLTSPPLTRSRSRDLRKFPSTPSSPRSSASRKTSESDSDEVKGVRGRQRVKKN